MIYFIRDTASGLVKIGYAEDPWSRINKIRSDCPGEVEMMAMEPGGFERERELHARFSSYRVRGEWFEFAGAVATYVASLPRAVREAKSRRNTWGASDLTDDDVARAVGISRSQACRIRNRTSTPTLKAAVQIQALTGIEPAFWVEAA